MVKIELGPDWIGTARAYIRTQGIQFLFKLANGQQTKPANSVGTVSAAGGTNGRTLTTAEVTFTASGGPWNLAKTKFLATTADGESYDVTVTIASEL